jgi:hypothetical protein
MPTYQNRFVTKLSTDISVSDTTITLDTPPTPTSGRLVLEARNISQNEIIKYTGVTGNQITGVTRGQGGTTAKAHSKNALVEMNLTAEDMTDLYDAFNTFAATNNDWRLMTQTVSSVVHNGQRSYDVTFNSTVASLLSNGMRLRFTRNTAAPTQCTSLNGTNQYYSKTTPSGISFTDDFVVSGWVKLSSYPSVYGHIASRLNGTSGWSLAINSTGQVRMVGYNAGGANYSEVKSYQSLPLNKWVHVTAQLDMSAFTATTTTSYVMLDGVDVAASVARGGTNPTALIQAGNLEIGSANATEFFPGKVAQVGIFSAKVTQATIRGYISQTFSGSETSLVTAYSFNNSINDLTANANNLTANNSAVATNADSPFGNSAVSSTLEYGIVTNVSTTVATVQVPEGCAIPTTGSISAVSYGTPKAPYGFPTSRSKWVVETVTIAAETVSFGGTNVWTSSNFKLTVPVGSWKVGYKTNLQLHSSVSGGRNGVGGLHAATSNPLVNNVYNTKLITQPPYMNSSSDTISSVSEEDEFLLTAAEDFVFKAAIYASTGAETYTVPYNSIRAKITAQNAYL